jgi:enolase
MVTIKKINAWSIFDSNGNPTLKGELELSNDTKVIASVPSTFSDGKIEAYELRDKNNQKFNGLGVEKACFYINHLIASKLIGVSPVKQKEIDYWLLEADNTENKSILGANTTLLISTLVAKAGAVANNLPLFRYFNFLYGQYFHEKINIDSTPRPIFNLIDGGRHGLSVDFQEYYVFYPTTSRLEELFNLIFKIKIQLVEALKKRGVSLSFGNFGGFAPNFSKNIDPLEILIETASYINLINGVNFYLGVDFSANNFYRNENYHLQDQPSILNKNKYFEYVSNITKNYHFR